MLQKILQHFQVNTDQHVHVRKIPGKESPQSTRPQSNRPKDHTRPGIALYRTSQSGGCCSVAKSCPTQQPHGALHTRLSCLSLSPGVCWNSRPQSQWCHPTVSCSVTLLSSFTSQSGKPHNSWALGRVLRRVWPQQWDKISLILKTALVSPNKA